MKLLCLERAYPAGLRFRERVFRKLYFNLALLTVVGGASVVPGGRYSLWRGGYCFHLLDVGQSAAMAWVFHRLYEVVRRPRFRDARLFMLIFYPPVFTFWADGAGKADAVAFLFPGCFSSQFYVPAAVCLREKHTGEESLAKINLTALDGFASMGT